MAIRRDARPATVRARIVRLEADVHIKETFEQRYQRALFTQWLAASEHGAELWAELEAESQEAGGIMALVGTEQGRRLVLGVIDDFYAVPDNISVC